MDPRRPRGKVAPLPPLGAKGTGRSRDETPTLVERPPVELSRPELDDGLGFDRPLFGGNTDVVDREEYEQLVSSSADEDDDPDLEFDHAPTPISLPLPNLPPPVPLLASPRPGPVRGGAVELVFEAPLGTPPEPIPAPPFRTRVATPFAVGVGTDRGLPAILEPRPRGGQGVWFLLLGGGAVLLLGLTALAVFLIARPSAKPRERIAQASVVASPVHSRPAIAVRPSMRRVELRPRAVPLGPAKTLERLLASAAARERRGEHQAASCAYAAALELEPGSRVARIGRVRALVEQGESEGLDSLASSRSLEERLAAARLRVRLAMVQGDWAAAERRWNRLPRQLRGGLLTEIWKAEIAMHRGRLGQAEWIYRWLMRSPRRVQGALAVRVELGWSAVLRARSRPREACHHIQRALEAAKTLEDVELRARLGRQSERCRAF